MDRLHLAIEVRHIERLPEFPRFRNLPPELVIAIMAQADSKDLRRLIATGSHVRSLWKHYKRSIFTQMRAVQFPEFHGVFGEMPLFEDLGQERANSNAVMKLAPETSKKGLQTLVQVQRSKRNEAGNPGRTESIAPKQSTNKALEPPRTVRILNTGAIFRIPVRRASRTPRQVRHLKEVAFDYTFRVGTSRMKDFGLYQWLQHDDGWNFLEFLTYLQEFLDQHFRELNPI